jgi:hypothetical protein
MQISRMPQQTASWDECFGASSVFYHAILPVEFTQTCHVVGAIARWYGRVPIRWGLQQQPPPSRVVGRQAGSAHPTMPLYARLSPAPNPSPIQTSDGGQIPSGAALLSASQNRVVQQVRLDDRSFHCRP